VLQYNKINTIHPQAFKGLNKLEALFLDYNQMINLPSQMLNFAPNLLHFSISHNNITKIPNEFFHKTEKLESMNLAHNLLETFDGKQFDNLPNLESVQLEHNKITQLDLVSCKSTTINVDDNQLEEIELNKWTRVLSAWNNPIRQLTLHEHYGTGRNYNFSFNQVNEIVFFVHEQCCALENLENFHIITHSIGDLAQKKFKIEEWTCKFEKNIGYETNNGFVTNNVCTRYVRGKTTTQRTTPTTIREQISAVTYKNRNTALGGFTNQDLSSESDTVEKTTISDDLFTRLAHDADISESDNNESYTAIVELSTEIPEIKLEKSYWQKFKSSMSKTGNAIKNKWNEWTG
jgi:Leucine rich repeat